LAEATTEAYFAAPSVKKKKISITFIQNDSDQAQKELWRVQVSTSKTFLLVPHAPDQYARVFVTLKKLSTTALSIATQGIIRLIATLILNDIQHEHQVLHCRVSHSVF
jgi:hypothetical protein